MTEAMKRGVTILFAVVFLTTFLMMGLFLVDEGKAEGGNGVVEGTLLGLDTRDYTNNVKIKVSAADRALIRHHKLAMPWDTVQKDAGTFDWSYYDAEITNMLADGCQSILLLLEGQVPTWARDAGYGSFARKAPPQDWMYFYDFCAAVAQRYGDVVDFYEIWNEPGWDSDGKAYQQWKVFHFGGQVETEYLPMLQVGYAAVKKYDPSAMVICGALMSSTDPNPTQGTGLYDLLFDDAKRPGQDVTIGVSSQRPIIAERSMYFNSNGLWDGGNGVAEAGTAQQEWVFDERSNGRPVQDYICLQNPDKNPVDANLTFTMTRGEVLEKTVSLPGKSLVTLNINSILGFQGCCDAVAIHTYKAPWDWGAYYYNCVQAMRSHGAGQEGVVTEVGWPNSTELKPDPYTEAGQTDAIGSQGVGGLFANGCRKIWIYKAVDEPPGKAWDAMYYGLFNYLGSPHPAWDEYKKWQTQLLNYPQLPSSWTP
jgi:hypothetical protein